jgi:hypothetical protein
VAGCASASISGLGSSEAATGSGFSLAVQRHPRPPRRRPRGAPARSLVEGAITGATRFGRGFARGAGADAAGAALTTVAAGSSLAV